MVGMTLLHGWRNKWARAWHWLNLSSLSPFWFPPPARRITHLAALRLGECSAASPSRRRARVVASTAARRPASFSDHGGDVEGLSTDEQVLHQFPYVAALLAELSLAIPDTKGQPAQARRRVAR